MVVWGLNRLSVHLLLAITICSMDPMLGHEYEYKCFRCFIIPYKPSEYPKAANFVLRFYQLRLALYLARPLSSPNLYHNPNTIAAHTKIYFY